MSNLKDDRYTKFANKQKKEEKKTSVIEHRIIPKNNINLKPFQYTYKVVMNKKDNLANNKKLEEMNSNYQIKTHNDFMKNDNINLTSQNFKIQSNYLKDSFNYDEEIKKFSYFIYKHKNDGTIDDGYKKSQNEFGNLKEKDESLDVSISDLKIKRKLMEQKLRRCKSYGKQIPNNSRNYNSSNHKKDSISESEFNTMKNNIDIPIYNVKLEKLKINQNNNDYQEENHQDNNLISFNPDQIINKVNYEFNPNTKKERKGSNNKNELINSKDDMYLLSNDIDFRNSLINPNLSASIDSKKYGKSVNALINLSSEEMINRYNDDKNYKQSEKIEFLNTINSKNNSKSSKINNNKDQDIDSIPILIEKDLDRFKKLMIELSEYFLLKNYMKVFVDKTIKEEENYLNENFEYYNEKQRIYKLIYNFALFKKTTINTKRGRIFLEEENKKAIDFNNKNMSIKLINLLLLNERMKDSYLDLFIKRTIKLTFNSFFRKLKDNANKKKIINYCNYKRMNNCFLGLKQLILEKRQRIQNSIIIRKFYSIRNGIKALKLNYLKKQNNINNSKLQKEFRKTKLKKEIFKVMMTHYKLMLSFNKNNLFKKAFNSSNIPQTTKKKELNENDIKNYNDSKQDSKTPLSNLKTNDRYIEEATKDFIVLKIENKKSVYKTEKGFKTVISKKVNIK